MVLQAEISSLKKHASDKADLASVTEVDTAAEFTAGETEKELDPVEALRIRCVAADYLVQNSAFLPFPPRRKIDIHILPLMCSESPFPLLSAAHDKIKFSIGTCSCANYSISSVFITGRIQFMDKTTLGSSAILGIRLAIMLACGALA